MARATRAVLALMVLVTFSSQHSSSVEASFQDSLPLGPVLGIVGGAVPTATKPIDQILNEAEKTGCPTVNNLLSVAGPVENLSDQTKKLLQSVVETEEDGKCLPADVVKTLAGGLSSS